MSKLFVVFRKEWVDVLRDRRTRFFMLLIPTCSIPLLMWITTELMLHFREKLAREPVNVLVMNPEAAPDLVAEIQQRSNPLSVNLRLLQLLEEKTLGVKELAMMENHPQAFAKWLKIKGIDPKEFAEEIIGTVEDREFDPTPANLIAQAFPPNFRLITQLDRKIGDLSEPQSRELILAEAIRQEELAAAIAFNSDATDRLLQNDSAEILVYYSDTSDRSNLAFVGLRNIVKAIGKKITAKRIQAKDLPKGFANPLLVKPQHLPGPSMLAKILSQLLPFMIIVFTMMGAMYPAVDLGAGEKERGTLETLLVAPVSRRSIVLGKFAVVLATSMISALLATISLAVSLQVGIFSTWSLISGDSFSFGVNEALIALLMVLPTGCIFSALLLALSIFAKSFKEAQAYAAPLQLFIILPAFVSFIPGVNLDWGTASIPVVNVSLVLREILTGNLDQHWIHVGVVFLSTSILATVLLWFSCFWFQKEQVLFRN